MKGNAAIVFGVGPRRGIGAELCHRAARDGLHVFVNGRSEDKLQDDCGGHQGRRVVQQKCCRPTSPAQRPWRLPWPQ